MEPNNNFLLVILGSYIRNWRLIWKKQKITFGWESIKSLKACPDFSLARSYPNYKKTGNLLEQGAGSMMDVLDIPI